MVKKLVTLCGLAALSAGSSLFVVGCGSKTEEPPPNSINTGAPVDAEGKSLTPEQMSMDGPKKGAKGGGGP
ncbi:MAG: hypothetical protein WAO58_12595 [Fimbriimonadaceae bacterium]